MLSVGADEDGGGGLELAGVAIFEGLGGGGALLLGVSSKGVALFPGLSQCPATLKQLPLGLQSRNGLPSQVSSS